MNTKRIDNMNNLEKEDIIYDNREEFRGIKVEVRKVHKNDGITFEIISTNGKDVPGANVGDIHFFEKKLIEKHFIKEVKNNSIKKL
ncbi:MAG: hypothetical protein ACOC1O_01890 [bacterium]